MTRQTKTNRVIKQPYVGFLIFLTAFLLITFKHTTSAHALRAGEYRTAAIAAAHPHKMERSSTMRTALRKKRAITPAIAASEGQPGAVILPSDQVSQIEMLSPLKLRPAARNARTHNKKQIEAIVNSIIRFGYVNPIIIDGRYRIVAGHGRWAAAKQMCHSACNFDP